MAVFGKDSRNFGNDAKHEEMRPTTYQFDVKDCDKMSFWLSQAGWERLRDADEAGTMKTMLGKGSDVDPLVTRLLSDSYICFYHEEPSSHSSNSSSNLLNNMIQKVVKPLT
ncbi:hypothetical protein ANCDUO_17745 [Ancylostoma duodenale]|uniref:Uncharacterized protein n=2 Tax=Ancylostoma TaxID=29169 RepID=A0A0C2FZN9_9BILA|nr:hypothetical protein ANCDUO_17745 [Ancylostoma duodenale]